MKYLGIDVAKAKLDCALLAPLTDKCKTKPHRMRLTRIGSRQTLPPGSMCDSEQTFFEDSRIIRTAQLAKQRTEP